MECSQALFCMDSIQNKPTVSEHIIVQKEFTQSNDVVLPCNPENSFLLFSFHWNTVHSLILIITASFFQALLHFFSSWKVLPLLPQCESLLWLNSILQRVWKSCLNSVVPHNITYCFSILPISSALKSSATHSCCFV